MRNFDIKNHLIFANFISINCFFFFRIKGFLLPMYIPVESIPEQLKKETFSGIDIIISSLKSNGVTLINRCSVALHIGMHILVYYLFIQIKRNRTTTIIWVIRQRPLWLSTPLNRCCPIWGLSYFKVVFWDCLVVNVWFLCCYWNLTPFTFLIFTLTR